MLLLFYTELDTVPIAVPDSVPNTTPNNFTSTISDTVPNDVPNNISDTVHETVPATTKSALLTDPQTYNRNVLRGIWPLNGRKFGVMPKVTPM